jgi:type III restriction enzyme
MKLHFEPNLDYQLRAIDSVCDLFRGQEVCRTAFTVTRGALGGTSLLPGMENEQGTGNRLQLLPEQVLENLKDVQLRNGLRPAENLESGDFTVEMETGTGKTYVYLRTLFELNKRYGFTKFVIVVPSIAIKEGVYKSLQMTEDHFRSLYAGTPFKFFPYDSGNLGEVRNFATSPHIQIMIVTVGAIRRFGDESEAAAEEADEQLRREKSKNVMYRPNEKTGGEKPIDLISATRPILIVDEPQSVDGGLDGRGRQALARMKPLCTLRYSATHADKHHMLYRLDAVDAYEQKLVKQIEVASATVDGAHNRPYVKLVSVASTRGRVVAKIEVDAQQKSGVGRIELTVQDGDDLELLTSRPLYRNHRIGELLAGRGQKSLELRVPGMDPVWLTPGQAFGDVDPMELQRQMIRRTIQEHLDKEKRLRPQGIKVLSLFFIDQVDRYRQYDAQRKAIKGPYAQLFEEEYRRMASRPDYATLFQEVDLSRDASEVHDGYFSVDKQGGWTDTAENNQPNRESAERAYNLIMKHKERLLSLETPLKFIFSHSALREGWDNPNVFQICTLRDIRTERERRQTLGRGLRLCVNQKGERIRGFDVNTLTVIATESYQEFAENLQREIEADTGIRFGIVEAHQFATVTLTGEDGRPAPLGVEKSKTVWEHLRAAGHIDARGTVQDSLRKALKEGTLSLPPAFEPIQKELEQVLRKLAGRLEIKDANQRKPVGTRREVLFGEEFKALWDRIKHRTTYRLEFDNEKLIADCVRAVREAPRVPKARLLWTTAELVIGKAGVDAKETQTSAPVFLEEAQVELPDILTELQDRTQLTRRTIYRVLTESGRLDDFKRNPQQFIDFVAHAINGCKQLAVVEGIKYQRLGDEHYYAQQLFEEKELTGYLKNMMAASKSVHEYVVYDSDVEASFADQLEKNAAVKVYAKLPGWFTVPTPLGGYNPDWAVLVQTAEGERIYFVVETKGDLFVNDLRDKERAKIECGKAHFASLDVSEPPPKYTVARTLEQVLGEVEPT